MRNIIVFLALLASVNLFAQSDSTSTGEVVDAEIIIEKDKKIILPQADKISTPVEVSSFKLDPLRLSYEVVEPDFNFPDYKSDISFIESKEAYPFAKFQNYIRAGYGNFQSPLLEVGAFHQLEAVKLGARLFHESYGTGPIGNANSASSTSSIDLSARFQGEALEVIPKLQYTRKGYRFYGNTDRINSGFSNDSPLEVADGNFVLGLNLLGKKNDFNYFIHPQVVSNTQTLVNGNNLNKDSGFEIGTGFNLKLDEKISTGIDVEGFTSNYVGGLEYARSLFSVRPKITRTTDDLKLNAGFVFTSGKTGDASESGIYPLLDGSFNFAPKWSIYAALDGGVQWNSLDQLLTTNLFLDDSLTIRNTNLKSSVSGGIKGEPTKGLVVKTGVLLENYENLPFFVPAENDSSRFTLTYDGGTTTKFTFLAKADIAVNANTVMGANFEFYGYSLDSLEKAWHLPDYSISVYFSQNIKNKLLVGLNVIAQGGIEVPQSSSVGSLELDSFLDLNLSATYKVTDRLSLFMRANNLMGQEYEKFIGYPVRGATFKLGGTYRF